MSGLLFPASNFTQRQKVKAWSIDDTKAVR